MSRARTAAKPKPGDRWHDAEDIRWAVRHWAARIGVTLAEIRVRPMSRKWASISTAGRITLNTDLLGVPKDLGDFVIVHELVHLLAPNHGKVFKSFMYAYLPNWEERQRRLRGFGSDNKATAERIEGGTRCGYKTESL